MNNENSEKFNILENVPKNDEDETSFEDIDANIFNKNIVGGEGTNDFIDFTPNNPNETLNKENMKKNNENLFNVKQQNHESQLLRTNLKNKNMVQNYTNLSNGGQNYISQSLWMQLMSQTNASYQQPYKEGTLLKDAITVMKDSQGFSKRKDFQYEELRKEYDKLKKKNRDLKEKIKEKDNMIAILKHEKGYNSSSNIPQIQKKRKREGSLKLENNSYINKYLRK